MDFRLFNREFGNADLFLIDLILKGKFIEGTRLLDAGSGEGRNLNYFLLNNFDVFALDKNASALRMLTYMAGMLNPETGKDHFIEGDILDHPFPANHFDYILCLSVLHFANSRQEFGKMIRNLLYPLKTGGKIVLGMNSVFGSEEIIEKTSPDLYRMPDGSNRFLLDEEILRNFKEDNNLEIEEQARTLIIHGKESYTGLMLKKVSK